MPENPYIQKSGDQQQSHTRFIVGCITGISSLALLCGMISIFKGYAGQGGEIFVTTGASGLSGLVGFLGGQKLGQMQAQNAQLPPPPPGTTTELRTTTEPTP